MSTGAGLLTWTLAVALAVFVLGLLMPACAPAVVRLIARPYLGRWVLRRRGVGVGARVAYRSQEATVGRLTLRSAHLVGDDGRVLLLDNHRLARDTRVLAPSGEPVPVQIRFVVPGDTNALLVRQIAMRVAESSAGRHPTTPITTRAVSVRGGEMEFVVTAYAREAPRRDELLSEILHALYVGLAAAGVHPKRAGPDRAEP